MTPEYAEEIAEFAFIAILCLLLASGILLNAFIVKVNLKCWTKTKPLQAADLIITSLAMIRILLLFFYNIFIIDLISNQSVIKWLYPEYTVSVILSVEFCSLWWGSVLCVFYCVKITNYNNRLFIMLKMKISKMVPWLLSFSLVPSFLCGLPYKWVVFSIQSFNGTDGQTEGIEINWLNYSMILCAGSIIPFSIFCISAGLLILSLRRHTRNLGSSSGFSDAQRDIHLSVIRNMVSFLFFYVLYFLGSNLISLSDIFENQLPSILCTILSAFLPSLHPISLIASNRKLRNAFLTALDMYKG